MPGEGLHAEIVDGPIGVVHVTGELDLSTVAHLCRAIHTAATKAPRARVIVDLTGLEFCDECSDVIDTIQGVSDPAEDADLPLASWVHMERSGGRELSSFCDALRYGHYVRLPGSKKYGDDAMIEAARAGLQEVRQ